MNCAEYAGRPQIIHFLVNLGDYKIIIMQFFGWFNLHIFQSLNIQILCFIKLIG